MGRRNERPRWRWKFNLRKGEYRPISLHLASCLSVASAPFLLLSLLVLVLVVVVIVSFVLGERERKNVSIAGLWRNQRETRVEFFPRSVTRANNIGR